MLECSVLTDNSKKVSRKLDFIKNENPVKRNRISSDSESEEEIRPIKKRNKLTYSDLSIEFETNPGKSEGQRSEHLTPESENINYDVSF